MGFRGGARARARAGGVYGSGVFCLSVEFSQWGILSPVLSVGYFQWGVWVLGGVFLVGFSTQQWGFGRGQANGRDPNGDEMTMKIAMRTCT